MNNPLVIELSDGERIIVNEDQICTIQQCPKGTKLRLGNGDELICKKPTFEEWLNDIYLQNK